MSFAANQFVSRGYPNHACKNMDRYRKSFMNLRHRKNELGINNIAKYRDFHTVQKVARSSMQIQSISPNRIWAHTVPSMIFLCNSFEKKGSNLQCEAMQISSSDPSSSKTLGSSITMKQTRNSEKQFIERAIRLVKRVIQLCFTLFPVAALYPVHRFISSNRKNDEDSNSSDWYLKVCLRCVELSGAAVIKLMQWASSRPDLFGSEFCSVFCQLQDQTTPHSLRHTSAVMEDAYGSDWEKRIKLFEVLGSGCIGQVYKGQIMNKDGQMEDVAVKVIHPNVRDHIDTDLDLLRTLAYTIDNLPISYSKALKWLNLQGMADEFASMLKIQLDLRTEAQHLDKFNENFAHDPDVIFPQVVKDYETHPDVLIETFCEGVPVIAYANANKKNEKKLNKLCKTGIKTVCKMIFEDNFVHSDLHPGNIFVSPDGEKLVVLDAGIVTEHTDTDHELIVSILASFINNDGRKAGRLMIEDSNQRRINELKDTVAVDEDGYIGKIEAMTKMASGENYLMEKLGTYITYICEAASSHHVMINQSFVSICLAVKVQEGVALSLDPAVEIWRIANPIIVRAAFHRRIQKNLLELQNTVMELVPFKSKQI